MPSACGSPWEFLAHVPPAVVAIYAASRAAAWLPECLAFVRTPSGMSHDALAYLPLVLDFLALLAIASPVGFRSVVDLASTILERKKAP